MKPNQITRFIAVVSIIISSGILSLQAQLNNKSFEKIGINRDCWKYEFNFLNKQLQLSKIVIPQESKIRLNGQVAENAELQKWTVIGKGQIESDFLPPNTPEKQMRYDESPFNIRLESLANGEILNMTMIHI